MRIARYILSAAGEPVLEPDLASWREWFERLQVNRIVADHGFKELGIPGVRVSTLFLGVDRFLRDCTMPELWETVITSDGAPVEYFHCAGSREQAEAMPVEALNLVLARHGMELRRLDE